MLLHQSLLALPAFLCKEEEPRAHVWLCVSLSQEVGTRGWAVCRAGLVLISGPPISLSSVETLHYHLEGRGCPHRGFCGGDEWHQQGISCYHGVTLEAEALGEMPLVLRLVICLYVFAVPEIQSWHAFFCAGN